MEMYFYFQDQKDDCLVWYYYIGDEIFYYRNLELKRKEIERVKGAMINNLSTDLRTIYV
jgi:hypothetical protein